jgi:hypothetical protein
MSRARHYSTCALVRLVCFTAGTYVAGRHATYGEWAKVLGLGADDRDRLTGQPPRRD